MGMYVITFPLGGHVKASVAPFFKKWLSPPLRIRGGGIIPAVGGPWFSCVEATFYCGGKHCVQPGNVVCSYAISDAGCSDSPGLVRPQSLLQHVISLRCYPSCMSLCSELVSVCQTPHVVKREMANLYGMNNSRIGRGATLYLTSILVSGGKVEQ